MAANPAGDLGFLLGLANYCASAFTLPSLLFLVSMREAREGEEALRKLRHFKLQDAQCFSEEDRIAIVSLIAKWWGEDEALTASNDAGIHRFEQYVYVGREGNGFISRPRTCIRIARQRQMTQLQPLPMAV